MRNFNSRESFVITVAPSRTAEPTTLASVRPRTRPVRARGVAVGEVVDERTGLAIALERRQVPGGVVAI